MSTSSLVAFTDAMRRQRRCCCLCLPARSDALAANGGVAVDDTDVDPVGNCKVDSWASFASNRDRLGVVSPGCVFDFGRPVDITFGFRARALRWRLGIRCDREAAHAHRPGRGRKWGAAVLRPPPPTTSPRTSWRTSWSTSRRPSRSLENFKINLNGGWLYNLPNERHWGTWGASFDWSVNDKISLIGEAFGLLFNNDPDKPHAQRSAGAVRGPVQAEREYRLRRDLRPQHLRRECALDHGRPEHTLQRLWRAHGGGGTNTDPEAGDPQIDNNKCDTRDQYQCRAHSARLGTEMVSRVKRVHASRRRAYCRRVSACCWSWPARPWRRKPAPDCPISASSARRRSARRAPSRAQPPSAPGPGAARAPARPTSPPSTATRSPPTRRP